MVQYLNETTLCLILSVSWILKKFSKLFIFQKVLVSTVNLENSQD